MPPTSVTLNAILGVLQSHAGQRYCASCLAGAAGIADANEIRRVMDRASEIPDLVIGHQDEVTPVTPCGGRAHDNSPLVVDLRPA
jgi:hypothetical protein